MTYDVLVVGARVAGSSLALHLARRGRRVLLVDRDRFPSDTLSTHFLPPAAVEELRALGVLPEIEAAGFRAITRARTWFGDCFLEGPLTAGGGHALAPRRSILDPALVAHAMGAGAEFHEQLTVDALIEDGGRVAGAVVRSADGTRHEVHARVVVGADGRHSKIAELTGARAYREVPPLRPVYYGYCRGLEPLPDPALEVWFEGDRMAFVFPMRPGEDCIALEIQPEDFPAFRTAAREAFDAHVRGLPGMSRRMRHAAFEERILGTRGVENYFRKPYGPGWALTGDAGHQKDPGTASGIGDALTQATLLADALDSFFQGTGWEDALSTFQRRRDEAMLPGYQATVAHAERRDLTPGQLAWVRAIVSAPPLLRIFVNAVPGLLGQAYPPEAMQVLREMARAFHPDAPQEEAAG